MNKICYLHLGLHKTASTSFQSTCKRNENLLKSFDITYPTFKCSAKNKNSVINHGIPICSLFHQEPKKAPVNIRWNICDKIDEINTSYNKQLEEYLEESNNIILSGESISTLGKDEINKFINKVKNYDYKVKALALVRRPYAFYCSSIQEMVKKGQYKKRGGKINSR